MMEKFRFLSPVRNFKSNALGISLESKISNGVRKEEISKIPKTAGVYAFFEKGEFLYIGKAANLRERIKNHFHPVKYREAVILPKAKLFNRVKQIGYIKTSSEIEALILEASLIKKYQPKYNIVWRDDKNYFFVAKMREDFPRIFLTHQTKLKIENCKLKINYVGPFVEGKTLKETLKVLRKVFPYRSCNKIPKRPCLWYQLNRCPAPCQTKIKKQKSKIKNTNQKSKIIQIKNECQRNIRNVIKIIKGKRSEVLKDLKKEMKEASLSQDYERAAKIRDQIEALKKIISHARIFERPLTENLKSKPWHLFQVWKGIEKKLKEILKTENKILRIESYDVSNIQGQEATGSMVTFIKGIPNKNFYRRFKIKIAGKPDDISMLKEVLSRRFKHPEWPSPDLILIDGGKAQLNVAINLKSEILNLKSTLVMALAKKKNELYIENQKQPILLKKLPREIFNLILQLRDEAHRFAITYHKKLREKNLLK